MEKRKILPTKEELRHLDKQDGTDKVKRDYARQAKAAREAEVISQELGDDLHVVPEVQEAPEEEPSKSDK